MTAYINEEFAGIKEKESLNGETAGDTTQKTTRKTREIILNLIKDKPTITREELADVTGITTDGVKYHIKKLKEERIIERVGGDKGGYWKVNDEE